MVSFSSSFHPGTHNQTIWRFARDGAQHPPRHEEDTIAVEAPIALEFNGLSHAVLLASPCDLADLAVGFAYTEGVIRQASDVYDVQVHAQAHGYVVAIEVASACMQQLKQRRRQIAGRTGCGLCGLESLSEVMRPLEALAEPQHSVNPAAIFAALEALRARQPLHLQTGATHAAALATAAGEIQVVREDVGRHNALDKLIGHLLRTQSLEALSEHMAVVSSRASFEMVQKTAAAGLSTLVAVSAPTSLAIELAQQLNLLLVGFGRQQHFSAYSHAHRLAKA